MLIKSIDDAVEYVNSWSAPGISAKSRQRALLLAAEGHRRNESFYRCGGRLTEASLSAAIAEFLEHSAGVLDVARAG